MNGKIIGQTNHFLKKQTNREWLNGLSYRCLAEIIVHPTTERGIREAFNAAANEWDAILNVEDWLNAERIEQINEE